MYFLVQIYKWKKNWENGKKFHVLGFLNPTFLLNFFNQDIKTPREYLNLILMDDFIWDKLS